MQEDDQMDGRVALITGASSGIGRATAFKFAAEGCRVALVARSAGKLAEIADQIAAGGGEAATFPADVTQEQEVKRVVREVVAAYGGIDVLVNAAGIIATGTVENTRLEDWDYMMNLNVRAPFYLMQCAMPYLIERQGNVVNVSSVTGLRAFPGILSYCASKAAVDQLTRCAALEVAGHGVRVNAINPGVIVTMLHRSGGMDDQAYAAFLEHSKTTHPLGRVGRPEEAADLIYFLASPQAGWITGVTVAIDGGRAQTCAR
jgi:NAD(P)-dependent dehydrogenase (short-subunit alcohol dehydrogenase family)